MQVKALCIDSVLARVRATTAVLCNQPGSVKQNARTQAPPTQHLI